MTVQQNTINSDNTVELEDMRRLSEPCSMGELRKKYEAARRTLEHTAEVAGLKIKPIKGEVFFHGPAEGVFVRTYTTGVLR